MINSMPIAKKLKTICWMLLLLPAQSFATIYYFPYLGGSVAASAGEISNDNPTITYSSGTITDAYPLTSRTSTRAVLSLNGGFELMGQDDSPTFDVGIGVYSTPAGYGYNGNLVETAAGGPSTALFTYTYKVVSTRLMAEAQVNWVYKDFAPFINGGIGVAWNSTKSYDEAPIADTTYSPLPNFQNKSMTNLAYQLGVGISYSFSTYRHTKADDYKSERISLGYRYANLGNAEFGTRGATYPYPLDIGSLKTNEIYFSYTHLF